MICEISELEPDEDDMTMMSRKTTRKGGEKHTTRETLRRRYTFTPIERKKREAQFARRNCEITIFTPIEKKRAKSTSERRTMSANVCSVLEITPFISTNSSKRMLARRYHKHLEEDVGKKVQRFECETLSVKPV